MTESNKHFHYFSTIYGLYQSSSNTLKSEMLKSLVVYGHFPDFINYLNQIWFTANITPITATKSMEFLILYFQTADEEHIKIDYGNLSELAQFLIRIFYQKAQPLCFKDYGKCLFQLFTIFKELDANSIYDVLIKCSFESALFPLAVFGVINAEFTTKIIKLLFSLNSTSFQKKDTKITWIESFIFLISYPIKCNDRYMQKILTKIEELLNDSTIITDQKLRILYSTTQSLAIDQYNVIFQKFYTPLLKNISPKTTSEGISYIFKVASEYYKILGLNKKGDLNEINIKQLELVLNPLFINSLPFFFTSQEIEKEAIEFASLLEPNILQKYISQFAEDNSFIRASLFFVSHYPTEKTLHVLFKPINNQIFLNAQREAIIYFLSHFTCPPHQLSIAFAILKASDLEENESIDKIIDTNLIVFCLSVIKYFTFCIDDIEKVVHFSNVFLKKKKIPLVSAPKYLNHSVLTLSVHFFGFKKHVKIISALICYLKACKKNEVQTSSNSSPQDQNQSINYFDYYACFNDESHIWPNFIHEALTADDEWREELCNISLQRLGKQEFQQCIVLAAISKDPMILHNSALLLIKDIKMIQILFIASATNWEKETINEIKNLINEYSKEQEETKRGFLASLFSRGSNSEPNYKPKIDIYTVVLNLLPVITQVLPFSSSLFDLLFTVFPADQKPQYMTLTCKAITSVCQLICADERQMIHSIIDRLCNSNLSMCDPSIFEATLIKALSVNQSMTEELATKIASLYLSMVLKKQISDDSSFEEVFLSDYYGDLTLNAFSKVLLLQLSKNEENEQIFVCFSRMLNCASIKKISYFQRFDHVLISNLLSSNSAIRKICFKSLDLIEQMNTSQETIEKIVKISNIGTNVANDSLLYFLLNSSKTFVNSLAKKFPYESSIILNELLLNHFLKTSYNNQVSILNFFYATLSLYASKYIDDDTNSHISLLFKTIRKIELNDWKCLNSIYTDILVCLTKLNSMKFILLVLDQTSLSIFNENHLNVLYNVESFIPLFNETIISFVKAETAVDDDENSNDQSIQIKDDQNKFSLPSVEVINRATQTLLLIIEQRDGHGFKYHDECILSYIIILFLTSASFSKWTFSFRNQHFKNLASIFAKFGSLPKEEAQKFSEKYLNSMNEGGISFQSSQYLLHFNLLIIFQMLLERTEFELGSLDKLNGTILYFLKFFLIAIKIKNANSSDEFDSYFRILLKEFENETFVNENLPSILFNLSDILTIDRLKGIRKNRKEDIQALFTASIQFFEEYSTKHKLESQALVSEEGLMSSKKRSISFYASLSSSPLSINSSIKLNSILFLRLILVMDKKFVISKIHDILKTMNIFVLYDPSILCIVELSAALIKIIKVEPDPIIFISHFNIIIIKMVTSLLSLKAEPRQVSSYFLSHLLKSNIKSISVNNDDNDEDAVDEIDNNLNTICEIDFKSMFSKLASLYIEHDKSIKRYAELAKSVLDAVLSDSENFILLEFQLYKEKSCFKDLEVLTAIISPLYNKEDDSESNVKEIISKYVDLLKAMAVKCDLGMLKPILSLISELTLML